MRFLQWFIFLLLSPNCLLHQAIAQDELFDHQTIAQKSVDDHILPGYRKFQQRARQLVRSFENLCWVPSKINIDVVYRVFPELVEAWGLIEHIRFGPVVEINRLERLALWPDPKGLGRRQIQRELRAKSLDLHNVNKLRKKSVALQGLTAIEVLLFTSKGDRTFREVDFDQFNCIFGKTISINIENLASEIINSWNSDTGYRQYWLNPGNNNPVYLYPKEVTRELALSYFDTLNRIREFKLAAPMGLRPNQLRATWPPFFRSNNSTRFIAANIQGVLNLLYQTGLLDKLNNFSKEEFRTVVDDLEGAIKTLNNITSDNLNDPNNSLIDFTAPIVKSRLIGVGAPLKNARDTGGLILLGKTGAAMRLNDSDGN